MVVIYKRKLFIRLAAERDWIERLLTNANASFLRCQQQCKRYLEPDKLQQLGRCNCIYHTSALGSNPSTSRYLFCLLRRQQKLILFFKQWPMAGYETVPSGVGSDHSLNCATSTTFFLLPSTSQPCSHKISTYFNCASIYNHLKYKLKSWIL